MVIISNESKGEYRLPIVVYLITLFLGSISGCALRTSNECARTLKFYNFTEIKTRNFWSWKEPLSSTARFTHRQSVTCPEANLNLCHRSYQWSTVLDFFSLCIKLPTMLPLILPQVTTASVMMYKIVESFYFTKRPISLDKFPIPFTLWIYET